jgi:DNA-binding GntR family transcriptional regulator
MTGRSRSGETSVAGIHQALRGAIVDGDLPADTTLRLSELSARFGVSPIPVREAVRLLQAEGFVVFPPHQSARVTSLSLGDLHEVYALRVLLEAEAVRLAVPRHNPIVRRRLDRLERDYERAAEAGLAAALAADRAVHALIWDTGGSERLYGLADLLWDHGGRYRHAAATARPQPLASHRPLLAAMSDGDGERAAAAIRHHLNEELTAVEIGFLTLSPTPPTVGDLVRFPRRIPGVEHPEGIRG